MKSSWGSTIGLLTASLFVLVAACQPPSPSPEELAAQEKARRDSLRRANQGKCFKYLSFATEYYKNKSYQDALNNYRRLFQLSCIQIDSSFAKDVFAFVGNCFRELGQMDSALYYYDKGLLIIPEDKYLRQSKIFTLKKLGMEDSVLIEQAELLKYDSTNLALAGKLADAYFENEQFEKARDMAQFILRHDPHNRDAMNILRESLLELGADIMGIVKARYDENPNDVDNALEYTNLLMDRGENESALKVLEKVHLAHPNNLTILQKLADVYSAMGDTEKLIITLKKQEKLNKTDINVKFELTAAYIMAEEYSRALFWADKAIKADPKNGRAWYNRGKVYEAVADACTGATISFDDKLVYQMALEDYRKAQKLGYGRAQAKIDFLKEARAPQKGDWFFNGRDYIDKKGYAAPKKDCYKWLKRKVKAPKG